MYCGAGEARSQEKQGSWLQTWACLAPELRTGNHNCRSPVASKECGCSENRNLYLEGGNAKDLPDYATINSVSLDSQSLSRTS